MLAAEKLGYFRGCPGLTRKAINKHLGVETATEKGWMTQVRQGALPTRSSIPALVEATKDEIINECTSIPQKEPGKDYIMKVKRPRILYDGDGPHNSDSRILIEFESW